MLAGAVIGLVAVVGIGVIVVTKDARADHDRRIRAAPDDAVFRSEVAALTAEEKQLSRVIGGAASMPPPVADLAQRVDCDTATPRSGDVPAGAVPTAAYDCKIGERDLGLFVYGSDDEAAAAFADLVRRCAPAVGGADWIVWANTNESATIVHGRLGGAVSLFHDGCP